MMAMTSRSLALAALLALAACATGPTAYAPAQRAGGPGYAETRIEADRYRVTFRDESDGARAHDLALLRAADLTVQNGYDWFVVTQRGAQPGAASGGGPRFSVGVGGANYGGNTSIGTGVGVSFGGGGSSSSGSAATIEIRMGKGAKPADTAAYDARDVQRSIGPRV
jgi:hypothetical protein